MRASHRLTLALSLLLLAGCKGDPNTPEYWEKAFKNGRRAQDRVRVIEDLRESKRLTPAFAPLLNGQLQTEKKAEVRAELAKALGELGDKSSVQPLTDAIDMGPADSDTHRMNREIAQALGRIPDPAAIPPLLRLLKSKDGYVQLEAIRSLGAQHAKEAVEPLVAMALDDSVEPLINRKAVQSLGEIGDARAIPALVKMMFKQHKTRGDSFYGDSSFSLFQIGAPARDAVLAALKGEDRALLTWARQNNVEEAALLAKSAQVAGDLRDRRAETVLIQRLAYQTEDPDLQMMVRMTVADALGRMRAASAVTAIAALTSDERIPARERYAFALARIGGRDAIPALEKAAAVGIWDARDRAISALSLVGDERELPTLQRLAKEETERTAKDCQQYDLQGCENPEALAKKHQAAIEVHLQRLAAAQECKGELGCWSKKLESKVSAVRERAALELGRAGKAEHAELLAQRISDDNVEARAAAIQALDWLIEGDPAAATAARKHLTTLDQQLDKDRSRTDYQGVNEDLRRVSVKLHRKG